MSQQVDHPPNKGIRRRSIWHIFWRYIWQMLLRSVWRIVWRSVWHNVWHSPWHLFLLSFWQLRSIAAQLRSSTAQTDRELAMEVQHCPLRSWTSSSEGLALSIAIVSWQLRSGKEDQEEEKEEEDDDEEEGVNTAFPKSGGETTESITINTIIQRLHQPCYGGIGSIHLTNEW